MEIQARILNKAEELFLTLGFKSVTMNDIAQELGISKKTIYQHFEDKKALVEAVCGFVLNNTECMEKECISTAENPVQEIVMMSKCMRDMLETMNPAIFYDLQKYYPKAWQMYRLEKERIRKVMLKNLEMGIEQGYFRNDLNVEILSRMRIELIDMAFNGQMFPAKDFSLIEVQEAFVDHFVRGVVTEKGLNTYNELKQNI
ncbi:TetR/AcrR family transcriptional regulator [Marinilongibacter aquaticus]|uniref:TetR/AcrR family transcriptional regulator n=1 Tax=Marinilongibacter aquaticus TaxID=2975157 RepID=UPI0021BD6F1E|nr:TetR/AcrR family transcriptional regulator [Marinilongibacter aquaticus]UBM57828.1 TetR/AcrR family transcriptional regulator [Marinilongibacter aquaticus]